MGGCKPSRQEAGYAVRIVAVRADGSELAACCTRRYDVAGTTVRDVAGEGFVARYFSPAPDEPRPAVIVLSGSDGRIEKAQIIASLFAAHGLRAEDGAIRVARLGRPFNKPYPARPAAPAPRTQRGRGHSAGQPYRFVNRLPRFHRQAVGEAG